MTTDNEPIFVHSLFRAGSTYLYRAFQRSDAGYRCYQEPLHELMLKAGTDPKALDRVRGKEIAHLRHPYVDGSHFQQLFEDSDIVAKHYREWFPYRTYFATDRETIAPIAAYFRELDQSGQGRSVFQCCRTLGRVGALRQALGGTHLFLERNPRDQWWSYRIGFDAYNQLVVSSPSAPDVIRHLCHELEIGDWPEFELDRLVGHFRSVELDSRTSYMLHYGLWCYVGLEARPACDTVISVDRATASDEYRQAVEEDLSERGIAGIDLSDCSIPIAPPAKGETQWFGELEAQVEELLASAGIGNEWLEWVREERREQEALRRRMGQEKTRMRRELDRVRGAARSVQDRGAANSRHVAELSRQLESVQASVARAEEQAAATQAELDAAVEAREVAEKRRAELAEEARELRAGLEEERSRRSAAEDKGRQLDERAQSAESSLLAKQAELDTAVEAREVAEKRLAELTEEVGNLRERVDEECSGRKAAEDEARQLELMRTEAETRAASERESREAFESEAQQARHRADAVASELERQRSEWVEQTEEWQKARDQAEQKASALRNELEKLQSSRSWRFTWPARSLLSAMRRSIGSGESSANAGRGIGLREKCKQLVGRAAGRSDAGRRVRNTPKRNRGDGVLDFLRARPLRFVAVPLARFVAGRPKLKGLAVRGLAIFPRLSRRVREFAAENGALYAAPHEAVADHSEARRHAPSQAGTTGERERIETPEYLDPQSARIYRELATIARKGYE